VPHHESDGRRAISKGQRTLLISNEIEDEKPPMPVCRDEEGSCEQTETDVQLRAVAMDKAGVVRSTETTHHSKGMRKRSRPTIDRRVAMKSDTSPVASADSKNEPTERERAVLHDQGEARPRRAWRSFTVIDNDLARRDRQRGRLKDALLTDREEAMERTQSKNSETVAEPKYQPTDYERSVLAKQAQRLKDQVRAPRMKFVDDQRGGRLEFDHPDQAIASALLNEAFGTADDQFAKSLLGYLCAALPIDENSRFEYPRADDLNEAISQVAAGKAVDGFHAQILADLAVCRITRERLLRNVSQPMRLYLSEELRVALQYYKDNPKGEVKIDSRPVLEFSIREAIRLMALSVALTDAANRYRATFESSRAMLSADTAIKASLAEIKLETSHARPKKVNGARARRLNGSAVHKLPQQTDSNLTRNGNGHAPA
jgi:hypothetical protein